MPALLGGVAAGSVGALVGGGPWTGVMQVPHRSRQLAAMRAMLQLRSACPSTASQRIDSSVVASIYPVMVSTQGPLHRPQLTGHRAAIAPPFAPQATGSTATNWHGYGMPCGSGCPVSVSAQTVGAALAVRVGGMVGSGVVGAGEGAGVPGLAVGQTGVGARMAAAWFI